MLTFIFILFYDLIIVRTTQKFLITKRDSSGSFGDIHLGVGVNGEKTIPLFCPEHITDEISCKKNLIVGMLIKVQGKETI